MLDGNHVRAAVLVQRDGIGEAALQLAGKRARTVDDLEHTAVIGTGDPQRVSAQPKVRVRICLHRPVTLLNARDAVGVCTRTSRDQEKPDARDHAEPGTNNAVWHARCVRNAVRATCAASRFASLIASRISDFCQLRFERFDQRRIVGSDIRSEARDYGAVSTHDELFEVPHDVVGFVAGQQAFGLQA